MKVHAQFDPRSSTLTYVVYDPATRDALVIDPVLDFDPQSVCTSRAPLASIAAFVQEHGLTVHCLLETHVHADHLSGAQPLKEAIGGQTGIGEHVVGVQATFGEIFGWDASFPADGRQWDLLARDGQTIEAGSLSVTPIHTPGHTPACVTYRIGDALFTGDTLFMPDFGTGRCDFPGGSAEALYDAVTSKLYTLPDSTRVFVGHDYQPGGRALVYETTIGASKAQNIQLTGDTSKEAFVQFRKERDGSLAAPRLLFQSVSLNVGAGHMPKPDANGIRRLAMPINLFSPSDDDGVPKE